MTDSWSVQKSLRSSFYTKTQTFDEKSMKKKVFSLTGPPQEWWWVKMHPPPDVKNRTARHPDTLFTRLPDVPRYSLQLSEPPLKGQKFGVFPPPINVCHRGKTTQSVSRALVSAAAFLFQVMRFGSRRLLQSDEFICHKQCNWIPKPNNTLIIGRSRNKVCDMHPVFFFFFY